MSRGFFALLAVALITALSAFLFGKPDANFNDSLMLRSPDASAPGGRPVLDHGCVHPSYDKNECFVPFTRLINFPERYQGREITTIGFLVLGSVEYYLYPSREDVDLAKGRYEAIKIYESRIDRPSISADLKSRTQEGVWVAVTGVFDAPDGLENAPNGALAMFHRAYIVDMTRHYYAPPPPQVHLKEPAPVLNAMPQFEMAPEAH